MQNTEFYFAETSTPHQLPEKETHLINTFVVNLLGGPGSGKSSICAGIFHDLKWKGIECEIASEFAKDLVWENRTDTLDDQIYVFGKQYHRIARLLGQVEVIVTDSPILLTPIYDKERRLTLERLVIEEHNKMWAYNVFLKRTKSYTQKGRRQDERGARNIDRDILDLLDNNHLPFEVFDATPEGKDAIVRKILTLLGKQKL